MALELVSVVIPCYNPTRFLEETLASVRAQSYPEIEIILVNDGTDAPDSKGLLRSVFGGVTQFIEQPNQGLAAARNTGFRAARGTYVLPLDADDRIDRKFITEGVDVLETQPEAAFVYTDYEVFGDTAYVERLGDYNLYHLLDRNTLIYASLMRRADWELAGGYDESMRLGYEDWDFWLRLGERGRFGRHLPQALFQYRKHGRSLLSLSREHHEELAGKIRANHPQLYSREGRARVKARWTPAVCVLGPEIEPKQTIDDWERLPTTNMQEALAHSAAEAFLVAPSGAAPEANTAELCALAVWGGRDATELPGGPLCFSRRALSGARNLQDAARGIAPKAAKGPSPPWPQRLERLHRHLVNAELLSRHAWLRHPGRSLVRLIPLRVKERINRAAGKPIFDLSFYLKFQPESVLTPEAVVAPLRSMPALVVGRRRIALVTPHLGPGGAESVLLEAAGAIDRENSQVLLLATQSQDSRWRARWVQAADYVYDLAAVVPPERMVAAVCSMAANWELEVLLIQNSLAAYSAIPHIRRELPRVCIMDLVHAVDDRWDFVSASAAVAADIDVRVVISDAGRRRLLEAGAPEKKIRLIRNGIDLERFGPAPLRGADGPKNILFAGRLDPIKRPLLLADIAAELANLRPQRDFRFLVAGDGAEREPLEARLRRAKLEPLFTLMGHVDDMPAVLAEADAVIVPSEAEGIPLIALEAFATARPVVCSKVGAAAEVVDCQTGVLVEPGRGEAVRFAGALHELLEDPERRREMGIAGRRKVEAEYDRDRMRQAYHDLFAP